MRWIAVAVVLLAPQDDSAVEKLLKRIDGRDVAESFRAIDALADLGPERRAEIGKRAADLSEFYRDALLAELKAPPPPPRVSSSAGDKRSALHLIEWARGSGIPISTTENDGLEGVIDFEFDRVHALEALAELCRRGQLFARQDPRDGRFAFGNRKFAEAHFGHRSAAVLLEDAWTTRRVDFAGPAPWRVTLTFETVLGAGIRPVRWDSVRIYEAVGVGGGKLEAAPPAEPSFFLDTKGKPVSRWDPKLDVTIGLPDGVNRIERLRFSASGLVASKERTVEVPGRPGKHVAGKLEVEVDAYRVRRGQREFGLRIRTTDPEIAKQLPGIFRAEVEYKDRPGHSTIWVAREIEGGVACVVSWDSSEEGVAPPKGDPDRIFLILPDGVEKRTVFAEFRDIHVR